METLKLAFKLGSSKHGHTRRAWVGDKNDKAEYLKQENKQNQFYQAKFKK